MKILQVNSVYNSGSTGKIVYDIHQELMNNDIESIVCYGRGKNTNDKNVYKICSEFYSHVHHLMCNITGIPYKGFFFSTKKLISIIKKEKPDIVHLQCINGYFVDIYKLVEWLKNNKIKTVLTLHAEFMYTGGCGHSLECNRWMDEKGCNNCYKYREEFHSYFFDKSNYMWKKMISVFDGFDKDKLVVTSVSPWLMERAQKSYAFKDYNHVVVLNGLDSDIFHPSSNYELEELKQKHDLTNEKIVFHATPYFNNDPNHIKGGYYVLQLAKMMEKENVKFIVAGPYDKNIEIPKNVILLGKISNQKELAKYYSLANVTVLTSKKETFSMVTAESLSCGTPIVGFKAGAPEIIAAKEYSEFVEYGNMDKLRVTVINYLNSNNSNFKCDAYSKQLMTRKYMRIYNDLL